MIRTVFLVPAIISLTAGEPQQAASPDTIQTVATKTVADEQDVGMPGYTAKPPCAPVYSAEVVAVGPVTGDPEKDTQARTVASEVCR